jgi:vacuolar-type H+-ATPase subunit I/STV1
MTGTGDRLSRLEERADAKDLADKETQVERLARLEERADIMKETVDKILATVEELKTQSQYVRGGIVLITALGGIITVILGWWEKLGGLFHK